MSKKTISIAALALATSASFADAQVIAPPEVVPVATASKKGSLLIFPYVTGYVVDDLFVDTVIEIQNNSLSLPAPVTCTYVNEQKGRINWSFVITPAGTVTWDVALAAIDPGTVGAAAFPTSGPYDAPWTDPYQGELICFVTDPTGSFQVPFNELAGTATFFIPNIFGSGGFLSARYNAWSFLVREAPSTNPAPDSLTTTVGTPGQIILDGGYGGEPLFYDACPAQNIQTFIPNGGVLYLSGTANPGGSPVPVLGSYVNSVSFSSCQQDLRQDFQCHLTKVQFETWNSQETDHGLSWFCADSVETIGLADDNSYLYNPSNFDFGPGGTISTNHPGIRTPDARYVAVGVASTECPGSYNTGLVGLAWQYLVFGSDTSIDALVASTTTPVGYAAGPAYKNSFNVTPAVGNVTQTIPVQSGFVLWDCADGNYCNP
ncbi:MAG TPA: hypothetical protein VK446_12890 [Methylocystis sp.]|nr:hypothetical protein [Methylocystis sp.]